MRKHSRHALRALSTQLAGKSAEGIPNGLAAPDVEMIGNP
jgi:hypothetical protein